MRGTIPGLPSAQRIGEYLPAVYQESDPLMMAFTRGFDEALAPIPGVLDSLAAYIDPRLAPPDFVTWLATWVAAELDETWPIEGQRLAVGTAIEQFRRRGTKAGLQLDLESATGGRIEIEENGGVAVSQLPGADFPGEPNPRVHIRVFVADPDSIDRAALERLVLASKPAWVAHTVEVRQE
jgi:phage tail-like protein